MTTIVPRSATARIHLLMTGIALATVVGAGTAHASTIKVSSTCTLQNAIKSANTNTSVGGCTGGEDVPVIDTIQVPPGDFLFQAALEFSSDVKVVGIGANMNSTTIYGSSNSGPTLGGMTLDDCDGNPAGVYINGGTMTFQNLTLRQTAFSSSAGICIVRGSVNILAARVRGFQNRGIFGRAKDPSVGGVAIEVGYQNSTTAQSLIDENHTFGDGAGLCAIGEGTSVNVYRSSIVNNFSEDGGGVYQSTLSGTNVWYSTISGNTASFGGGIAVAMPESSYLQIEDSTVVSNRAFQYGGGVYASPFASGKFYVFGSIITNNTSDLDSAQANLNTNYKFAGAECEAGGIVFGTGSSPPFVNPNGTWNFDGTCRYTIADAKVAPLAPMGGPNNLPVRALLPGSPALDVLTPSGPLPPAPDQRGVARPQTAKVDIGAVEMGPYFETESMPATWSSGVTHVVVTSSSYHAGKGTNLIASGVGNFVTYQTPSLTAGTYNVVVGIKTGTNGGKFQLSKAESSGGTFTSVGGAQDTYTLNNSWTLFNQGSVTISSTGAKFFKLTVTGHNASSHGYQLFPDFLILTKQ